MVLIFFKKNFGTILFLISSFILIIICSEVLIRIFCLAPETPLQYSNFIADPHSAFRLKPKSMISGRTKEYEFEYKTNSKGFRDREHSIKKPKGIFRILALGDSFTYGIGVKFEETYLFLLERMLNGTLTSDAGIEIINMGIPRYFPETERLLLEYEGMKYDPDLILVSFLPNDVVDTFLGKQALSVAKDSGYLITCKSEWAGNLRLRLYENSHTARIFLKLWSVVIGRLERKIRSLEWCEIYKEKGSYETAWKKIESEFEAMNQIAKNNHSRILFFHIPQQGPWTELENYPAERLKKWAHSKSVPFIDVMADMKTASRRTTLYYKGDGHCTREGHKIIAETLYPALLSMIQQQ